jgi:hypothetical protein
VAWALGVLGFGMGLAMARATDSIMSSLPTAKAGVGSAMDTTTRQVGGGLGVAVLGSVLTSAYRDQLAPALQGLPGRAATLARDSEGAALAVAARLGPPGRELTRRGPCGVHGGHGRCGPGRRRGHAAWVVLALIFLPAQPTEEPAGEEQPAGAAETTQP